MADRTSFGQWLKQRRKTLDLTRDELAQKIGCAAATLYKIEAGERRPSKQIADLLAEHLNIPPSDRAPFVRFARDQAAESSAPWGTSFHPSTNLPTQLTPLIGRDEEVTAIAKRLRRPESRLLTLIGPPGIGKTRLALQVATQMLVDFTDGVFFVPLAPIRDATLVPATIASILGVQESGPQTPLERLKVFLRDKQTLLVLDNFEQILEAAASIAELVAACPWLKLVVTSRAPLRIRSERQFPVPPLAVPDLVHLPDVEGMTRYSAVMLFIERAQAVKPDFSVNSDNAAIVGAICARLDGLPLAIELISVRVKLLTPAVLLERLDGRLMLYSDGLRDVEPRHRTLNAAIAWSYQLMNAQEQILFRRLGAFVGGWTLDAAEAVCAENLQQNVIDGLASLLDKNLIKHDTVSDRVPRFTMLETVREYARQQLDASGELKLLQQRHMNYFLELTEEARAHPLGREQVAWSSRLSADLDNLRTALSLSVETEIGLRLAVALGWFFYSRAHWQEGMSWLELALSANPSAAASLRAKALTNAALFGWIVRDERAHRHLIEQALDLARSAHDRWSIGWSLLQLGGTTYKDLKLSVALIEESLIVFREIGDLQGLSHALRHRTGRALDQHDYAYVRQLTDELASLGQQTDDKHILACVSWARGRLAWQQDHDLKQARIHWENSLSLFHEAQSNDEFLMTMVCLAGVEQAIGNLERAQTLFKEAMILHLEYTPNHPRLPFIFAGLAGIARARGQLEWAAQLLGAVNSDEVAQFAKLHPEIVPLESDTALVRAELGETHFAEAWAAGNSMSQAEVVASILRR